MTTPIERGAEVVLENFHGPDAKHSTWHLNPSKVARAVFESIDVDDAARVLWLADNPGRIGAEREWDSLTMIPPVYESYRRMATAIKAHLLGGA